MVDTSTPYLLELVDLVSSQACLIARRCFACGGEPTTGAGEHIIPRWLQNEFGLWDQRLRLLNGTLIPYRQLTIPCCQHCNNGFLSEIENDVRRLLLVGSQIASDERLSLGRWMAKVFVGFLIKESALPADRKQPNGDSIVPASLLSHYAQAQLILQSARKPTRFNSLHADFPFTLYRYRIFEDARFGDFDLATNLAGQSIAIRFGTVGAIFVNDGGLQHHVGPKGPFDLDGSELHPVQFAEVAARVHYKATLRDATHAYQTSETDSSVVVDQLSVVPYTGARLPNGDTKIFKEWDNEQCAQAIISHRPIDWGPVLDEQTGQLFTTLVDHQGAQQRPEELVATIV